MNFEFIILVFPVVFMLHEFEEIIFMRPWIKRSESKIISKFPKAVPVIVKKQMSVTTEAFSFIVAEEFLIVTIITLYAFFVQNNTLFASLLAVYTLHLLMHIGQAILLRSYIPALATSLLTAVYSIYTLNLYLTSAFFELNRTITYTLIILSAAAINLLLMHKLAAKIKCLQSIK
ncbi:HXXEE domain-containing protein [Saccharicrinis sp. FJH2]|uniref:HXXEE domain-containing protein n=1 Tax=Saccharicrinis sp. FJH65 TaxID=3344659 RepID=UPI0035F4F967